jgi:hypothetical protein
MLKNGIKKVSKDASESLFKRKLSYGDCKLQQKSIILTEQRKELGMFTEDGVTAAEDEFRKSSQTLTMGLTSLGRDSPNATNNSN